MDWTAKEALYDYYIFNLVNIRLIREQIPESPLKQYNLENSRSILKRMEKDLTAYEAFAMRQTELAWDAEQNNRCVKSYAKHRKCWDVIKKYKSAIKSPLILKKLPKALVDLEMIQH